MVVMTVGQENGPDRRLPAQPAQGAFRGGRPARIDQDTARIGHDQVRIAGVFLPIDAVDHLEGIFNLVDQPGFQGLVGGRDQVDPIRVFGE